MSTQPSVIERTRETQCQRLLRLLKNHAGWTDGNGEQSWVSLPTIMNLGIASHSKIVSLLRAQGNNIEMERHTVNGQLRTRYRLVTA